MTDRGEGWKAVRGDAVALLPVYDSGEFDSCVIDPPYNVKVNYETYSDDLPDAEYALWCGAWFAECRRVARRFVVVFPGHKHFGMWFRLNPSGVGCWHKPGSPKGGGSFRWCEWEPWLLWSKGGAWCGYSDTITAPLVSHGQKDTGGFPCPKPPGLYRELLKRLKPMSLLDPMFGSGTAGVEAIRAGVTFSGIEVAPGYFELGVKRFRHAAGEGLGQLTRPDLFTQLEPGPTAETGDSASTPSASA